MIEIIAPWHVCLAISSYNLKVNLSSRETQIIYGGIIVEYEYESDKKGKLIYIFEYDVVNDSIIHKTKILS